MNVAVIGSGYVGTTMAASFADMGHSVTAVDIDADLVDRLNAGESPIHEPGLADLIATASEDGLTATTAYGAIADSTVTFIAVPTPSLADGSIDLSALRAATREAAQTLVDELAPGTRHLLVVKSTVTPPQIETLREAVQSVLAGSDVRIELAMNPEFLREGSAVADFRSPDKLVFGVESAWGEAQLRDVFAPVIAAADPVVIVTDPETAAMIKYANNAFLAAKISLINEIGNISKEFGIDAYEVAEAIGTDDRIGERFLRSGAGWGGSCFPKDLAALIAAANGAGYRPALLDAVVAVNETQPRRMLDLLERHIDVAGKRVAVLGLAFKPGTDDIRNARAIPLIEGLQERGASVVGYDPVAMENMRARFPDIAYADSAGEALTGAAGALVVTDWPEFAELDEEFSAMAEPVVIDGRRIVEPPEGVIYEGLTW